MQLRCSKLAHAVSCFHNCGPSRVSRRRAAEAPSRIFPRPSYSPFTALQDAWCFTTSQELGGIFGAPFDPELERAHRCLKALPYRRRCAKRPAWLSLCGCVSTAADVMWFHMCAVAPCVTADTLYEITSRWQSKQPQDPKEWKRRN